MAGVLHVFWGVSVINEGFQWSWIIKPNKSFYEISTEATLFMDRAKAIKEAGETLKGKGGEIHVYTQGGNLVDSVVVK